jgi:putative FmdB family regulatory protein
MTEQSVAARQALCYRSQTFSPRILPSMPTYEYQCEKCKKSFECFQSMKDAPLKTCPKELCRQKTWGKGKVRRLLGTGAGLIFKGSGFYITDYRSEGYRAAAKSEASGGEAKAADAKKTETKPAAPASEKKKPAAAKKKE